MSFVGNSLEVSLKVHSQFSNVGKYIFSENAQICSNNLEAWHADDNPINDFEENDETDTNHSVQCCFP